MYHLSKETLYFADYIIEKLLNLGVLTVILFKNLKSLSQLSHQNAVILYLAPGYTLGDRSINFAYKISFLNFFGVKKMKKSIISFSIFILSLICCYNTYAAPIAGSPEGSFCPSGQTVCGGVCVSNVCSSVKTFNTATCTCKCSSNCPATGQIQDSNTCACNCPSGQTVVAGLCCPGSMPYNVGGTCSICNAVGRSKVTGSTEPDGCCPTGQVFEVGACRAPCTAPNNIRWSDATCHDCPQDKYKTNGQCCLAGQIYEIGACRAPCTAPNNIRWSDATCHDCPQDKYKVNGGCCPAGYDYLGGSCRAPCGGATPYRWNSDYACHDCPEGAYKTNGQCCVNGLVYEAGACRTPCTGSTPYRWSDNACHECPQDKYLVKGQCCPAGYDYLGGSCRAPCGGSTPYRWNSDYACHDCPEGAYKTNGQCCVNGYVYEVAACRLPCGGANPYRWADGSCQPCPQNNYRTNGACCPAGQVYEAGACRAPCGGTTPHRWIDGSCHECGQGGYPTNGGCCLAGYVFEVGMCRLPCGGANPYRWGTDGSCQPCPLNTYKTNGACCPAGQVYEAGACRAPCGGTTPHRWIDGSCHECGQGGYPTNGGCCLAGYVFEVGMCRLPCGGANPYRWGTDGSCQPCPLNTYLSNGACCPAGQVYEVGACRAPCYGVYPYRWSDGLCHECPQNQYRTNGQCCPGGYVFEVWACRLPCGGAYPYRWGDGLCHDCPEGNYRTNGQCCPGGYVFEAGACRIPCPPTAPYRVASNGTCSACQYYLGTLEYCFEANKKATKKHNFNAEGIQCNSGKALTLDPNANQLSCIDAILASCPANAEAINANIKVNTTGVSKNTRVVGNDTPDASFSGDNIYGDDAILACFSKIADQAKGSPAGTTYGILQKSFTDSNEAEDGWKGNTIFVMDNNCQGVALPPGARTCGKVDVYAYVSPISLLLDSNFDIDSETSVVNFPLNMGKADKWYTWKASKKAPLLVYDPRHQGQITSATQLFGEWTFGGKKSASLNNKLAQSTKWANGYEALATMDSNYDGKISDSELESLALWFDENGNGISEKGEVRSLKESGIISLFYKTDKTDPLTKNIFANIGFERMIDGKIETGRSVDWYGEEANSSLESGIRQQLLNTLEGNQQSSNRTESFIAKESKEQAKTENPATTTNEPDKISGVWDWKMENSLNEKLRKEGMTTHGSLILKNKANIIQGASLIEAPIVNREGKIFSYMVMTPLKGTVTKQKEAEQPSIISFEVPGTKAITKNTATLSADAKVMNGTSEMIKMEKGKRTVFKYSWTAKRKEFKKGS